MTQTAIIRTVKIEYSQALIEALDQAPEAVKKAFFKQIKLLEQNLRYPSLRARSTTNRKPASTRVSIFISQSPTTPTSSPN